MGISIKPTGPKLSPPPKAQPDITKVGLRKPDSILPTMDQHGVEDIVNHMGAGANPTPNADLIELAMRRKMPNLDDDIIPGQSDPVLHQIFKALLLRRNKPEPDSFDHADGISTGSDAGSFTGKQ